MITEIKGLLRSAYYLTEKAHQLGVMSMADDPQYIEFLRLAKMSAWSALVEGENKN